MSIVENIPIMREFNGYLKGAPDKVLTALLLGVAIAAVIVALVGNPVFKAAFLAWALLP